MEWNHITDHDLERYYLGMVKDEIELAALEEHILACGSCAERVDEAQDYVDAMRVAALDFDDPFGAKHANSRARGCNESPGWFTILWGVPLREVANGQRSSCLCPAEWGETCRRFEDFIQASIFSALVPKNSGWFCPIWRTTMNLSGMKTNKK
jgi:hypothetical protein